MTTTYARACRLLDSLARLSLSAGHAIETIRAEGIRVEYKSDHSPLTKADLAAENIICHYLQRYEIPIVSEEASPETMLEAARASLAYWLVDPLDGTREFVSGRTEFTVNIALIFKGFPILGAVYAPALSTLYLGLSIAGPITEFSAASDLRCAWKFSFPTPQSSKPNCATGGISLPGALIKNPFDKHRIQSKTTHPHRLHALLSASHLDARTEAWVRDQAVLERSNIGSSLKFCLLAEGLGDVYPRFAPTMAWDTAAGQAILEAAGGIMLNEIGERFQYGSSSWLNPPFIAWADALLASKRFVKHDAAGYGHIHTGNLAAHRQVHELIASLSDKAP